MTISRLRGRSTLRFFRLCVRAPRMRICSIAGESRKANLLLYKISQRPRYSHDVPGRARADVPPRTAREPVARVAVRPAHARAVPDPTGVRRARPAARRRRQSGARGPGAGNLRADPGDPADSLRHGLRPLRQEARDRHWAAVFCTWELCRRMGVRHLRGHSRARDPGGRRHRGAGHGVHRRYYARRTPHQGDGHGRRFDRIDLRGVARRRARALSQYRNGGNLRPYGRAVARGDLDDARGGAPEPRSAGDPTRRVRRGALSEVLRNTEQLRLNLGIFSLHVVQMAIFVVIPVALVQYGGLAVSEHWKIYLPVVLGSFALMMPPLLQAERRGRMKFLFLAAIVLLLAVELGFAVCYTNFTMAIALLLA